jgi:hypothetical protein
VLGQHEQDVPDLPSEGDEFFHLSAGGLTMMLRAFKFRNLSYYS